MQDFLDSIVEALLWIPRKLYEQILDGLVFILESIPVPDFVQNISSLASGVPSSVLYYIEPLNLGTGIGILVSSFGIRFLIRRIPFIG